MPGRMVTFGVVAGALGALSSAAATAVLHAPQQVQVIVTAVPDPLAPGTCAGIWAEVRNAQNERLLELNGMALHSRAYDLSIPHRRGAAYGTPMSSRNGAYRAHPANSRSLWTCRSQMETTG